MRTLKYIALFFIGVLVIGCEEDTIDPQTFGSIFGEVLLREDNSRVANANISTTPPSSTLITDAEGRFSIENIATGTYSLRVEKEGFETVLTSVTVFANQQANVVVLLDVDSSANISPMRPFNPFPAIGTENVNVSTELRWSATDVDEDDLLSYDLILFNSDQTVSETVASGITDTFFTVEGLLYNRTYLWQVVVNDGSNDPVFSEIWNFQTRPIPELRLLYTKENFGKYDIFASNLDQSILVQLTDNGFSNWRPRMSPTRDKIAFISNAGIGPHLYTMDRDGQNVFQVTSIPISGFNNFELDYSWSPDGTRLLYMNNTKLYSINRNGTGLQEVAEAPSGSFFSECDWTAQGDRIVIRNTGPEAYNSQISVYDNNGNFQLQVFADVAGGTEGPVWSIDGSSVLFAHDVSGFESSDGRKLDSHIFIKNIITNTTIDLSIEKPEGTNDLDPRFSPDGSKVIFVNTNNDGISTRSIWTVDLTGEDRDLLVEDAEMPEWK